MDGHSVIPKMLDTLIRVSVRNDDTVTILMAAIRVLFHG